MVFHVISINDEIFPLKFWLDSRLFLGTFWLNMLVCCECNTSTIIETWLTRNNCDTSRQYLLHFLNVYDIHLMQRKNMAQWHCAWKLIQGPHNELSHMFMLNDWLSRLCSINFKIPQCPSKMIKSNIDFEKYSVNLMKKSRKIKVHAGAVDRWPIPDCLLTHL